MKTIRIQNYYGCNLHCKVCPCHSERKPGIQMTEDVFDRVLARLKEYDGISDGYYTLLGHNGEPTVDVLLKKRISLLKNNLSHAVVGVHTNGLKLKKDRSFLSQLDYVVISILGAPEGRFSFNENTGLNFDEHVDLIMDLSESYEGIIMVMLSLPDLTDKILIEEITGRLKGPRLHIMLNQLNVDSTTEEEDSGHDKAKADISNQLTDTGINNPHVMMSTTITPEAHTACDVLLDDLAINVHGLYDICCVPCFGEKKQTSGVDNTGLDEFFNGEERKFCIEFLKNNQDIPLTSCDDCVLLRTPGIYNIKE